MNNLDDLKSRIEQVLSEAKAIMSLFEREMSDPRKNLQAAKEIETTVKRFKRQRLHVPEELNRLKLQMAVTHQENEEILALYRNFMNSLRSLTSSEAPNKPTGLDRGRKSGQSGPRKPLDYEKPLGAKGYSNVEDYLIPVIKLMWEGRDHREAFHQIARKLDVRYNTVSAQCTRALGLTTDEFVTKVQSRTIVDLIEGKYSNQYQLIRSQLKR
jgi:hypothetical protein